MVQFLTRSNVQLTDSYMRVNLFSNNLNIPYHYLTIIIPQNNKMRIYFNIKKMCNNSCKIFNA